VHTTITTAATVTEKDKEIEKKIAIEQTGMMSSKELEAAAAALGIRVVRPFFSDYGGQMKAWYNDWKPNQ
jgi:LmbE family N-acetylglucosaminyl deacetylase